MRIQILRTFRFSDFLIRRPKEGEKGGARYETKPFKGEGHSPRRPEMHKQSFAKQGGFRDISLMTFRSTTQGFAASFRFYGPFPTFKGPARMKATRPLDAQASLDSSSSRPSLVGGKPGGV